MKIIILLMFSLALASAQETSSSTGTGTISYVVKPQRHWTATFYGESLGNPEASATIRQVEDDYSSVEIDLGGTVLRGAGKVKAPFLSLQREANKQGVFLAALPFGGTFSLYRKDSYGNHREFIRMSYGGIQVAKDDGDLQETFTGEIDPNCRPVVVKGLVVGQNCAAHVGAIVVIDGQHRIQQADGSTKPFEWGANNDLALNGDDLHVALKAPGSPPSPICTIAFLGGMPDCIPDPGARPSLPSSSYIRVYETSESVCVLRPDGSRDCIAKNK